MNALSDLDKVCDAVEDNYLESLREDTFEMGGTKVIGRARKGYEPSKRIVFLKLLQR